jgi:hypothetical protein
MFEAGAKAPLHRLTPLRDDPAVAWLSPSEKFRMNALAWFVWVAFLVSMFVLRFIIRVLLFVFVTRIFTGRISYTLVGLLTAALIPGVRRSILRMKIGRVSDLLRRDANHVAADDWEALAREPEGQVASVLGWVRGRAHLSTPIGGEPAVGVAIPCQSTFPGVLEAMHDFEICDEEGRTILIQMADARTFGAPNVALDGRDLQMLFAALELPTGVTASAFHVHALRDGDPVMVVGFKRMTVDPDAASMRGEGQRLALGSSGSCPLLVFSIEAERRPVSPAQPSAAAGGAPA